MKMNSIEANSKRRVIKRVRSTLHNRDTEMDFTELDYVLGTRDPVTPWSTERRCALGNHPVYTSMVYPDDVLIVCLECASSISDGES
jgi:hypothetical protein